MTRYVQTNLFEAASCYLSIVKERDGEADHPLIRWWHSLCGGGEAADEIPWCSSFVNGIAHQLGLERSRSKMARSWLGVGEPISIEHAECGLDVVIFKRGASPQPGPEVRNAPGHVAIYDAMAGSHFIRAIGGNQGNAVTLAALPVADVLGIRRLAKA